MVVNLGCMLVERLIKKEIVMQQTRHFGIESEIEYQARRRHGAILPIFFFVVTVFCRKQLLFHMPVVAGCYHHICAQFFTIGQMNKPCCTSCGFNPAHLAVRANHRAFLLGQPCHAFALKLLTDAALGRGFAQGLQEEAVTMMEITQGFFYYDSIYLYSEVIHDPKKYEGFAERWRAKSMSIIPAQETGGIVVKFQF
jgi:hypothetical protein